MTITAENLDARQALREWIRGKARNIDDSSFTDQTKIIEEGLITSVDVLELFLLIEELGDVEIDATELEPGMLESVDRIVETFLRDL